MRAMILAAGRGERMRPLTDTLPKPLLPVGGKPLIVWHIERLVRAGMSDILINHAWLGEQIEARLGDGRRYGARIAYSAEPQALETAGGIAQALEFFRNRPFLVVNGDIWCDWDPAEALRQGPRLESGDRQAWLLLVPNPAHHPQGDFALAQGGGDAAEPAEVRISQPGAPLLTFSGIGVYSPALFAALEKGRPAPLAPLLRQAMRERRVLGRRHDGIWIDVGTPERLQEVDLRLRALDLARRQG